VDAIPGNGADDAAVENARAGPHLEALREALDRYGATGAPSALDHAFLRAASAIAVLRGERAEERADATEVKALMVRVPEFDALVEAAVNEAERSANSGAQQVWDWFGLRSPAPVWDPQERAGARLLVAFACAPLDQDGPVRLRSRLRRLASKRWAGLLVSELTAADDAPWRRALGERYESIRRRYAPRSKWHTRQLTAALSSDPALTDALRTRLGRWLAEDADFNDLRAELEAAFVQTRTPGRIA
jgi:hypothetical protein